MDGPCLAPMLSKSCSLVSQVPHSSSGSAGARAAVWRMGHHTVLKGRITSKSVNLSGSNTVQGGLPHTIDTIYNGILLEIQLRYS